MDQKLQFSLRNVGIGIDEWNASAIVSNQNRLHPIKNKIGSGTTDGLKYDFSQNGLFDEEWYLVQSMGIWCIGNSLLENGKNGNNVFRWEDLYNI